MNERERYGLENGLNRGEFVSSRRSINRLNRLLVNGEFELRVKYPSLRSYFHHGCARGSLYARQFPYDRWVCVYIPRQRGVCTRFDDSILAFVLHEDEDEIVFRDSKLDLRERLLFFRNSRATIAPFRVALRHDDYVTTLVCIFTTCRTIICN